MTLHICVILIYDIEMALTPTSTFIIVKTSHEDIAMTTSPAYSVVKTSAK